MGTLFRFGFLRGPESLAEMGGGDWAGGPWEGRYLG